MDEVKEAVKERADIILLDNMTISQINQACKIIGKKAKTEVSGGVNIKTIGKIGKTKADFVSVGALTHSVKSLDISLEITKLIEKK
jgi:nicotinate-nucleotide pyrophosphorylase (carboxylating)